MRKLATVAFAVFAVVTASLATNARAAGLNFGVGLHYLYTLGDIDEGDSELSKNSFGIIGSVQTSLAMLKIEGNVEYIPDFIGSDEGLWEPSAYALFGSLIYGGAGIGVANWNDEWTDPWYALRAGVNLGLGGLGLDVYGTYRFWSDDALEDLNGEDLDSVTFAAVLRFGS